MNKELKKAYLKYYLKDTENALSFNEWFDYLLEKADELDEYNFLNEDFIEAEKYYDALCEDINISYSNTDKNKKEDKREKKLDADKIEQKYKDYCNKMKTKGKKPLPYSEWKDRQNLARDLKLTMATAGIAVTGVAATKIGGAISSKAAKKIYNDKHEVKSKSIEFSTHGKRKKTTFTAKTEYYNDK